jgi:aminomethyltransferase
MIKTEYLQDGIWAEIYYSKELRSKSKVAKCTIRQKPFWMPEKARATPPPAY